MKKLFFIFVLAIVQCGLYAQQGIIEWEQTLGGLYEDYPEAMIKTKDSGFLIVGSTRSKGAGGKDIWAIKLNGKGEQQWEKVFGERKDDHAFAAAETKDGYLLFCINRNPQTDYADLWVIKLDKNGNKDWDRKHIGRERDEINALISLPSEEYIVAGAKEAKGDHDQNTWLMKLNKKGKQQWRGLSDLRFLDDGANDLIFVDQSDFYVVGFCKNEAGKKDAYLTKFDQYGNFQWGKKYGGEGDDEAVAILEAPAGRLLIVGMTDSKGAGNNDAWVMNIDKNGNVEWEKTYGGAGDEKVFDAIKTNDDAFVIVGSSTSKGIGETDKWILKVGQDGTKQWEHLIGDRMAEEITSIVQDDNGNYVTAGYTTSKGKGKSDIWVINISQSIETLNNHIAQNLLEMPAEDGKGPKINIYNPTVKRNFETIINQPTVAVKGRAESPAGIKQLTINGKEALFTQDGRFQSLVQLSMGKNNIQVKAKDNDNITSVTNISVSRGKSAGSTDDFSFDEETGKYYALLIGVEEYDDPKINDLSNPVKDAMSLYNTLIKYYTFEKENVEVLKNPTRADVIETLDAFSQKITEKDNLVVFYAGHGYWDKDKNLGYWLPADAKQNSTANWLRNSTIRDYIGAIKSKHSLLIADACFSGGIFKTRSAFRDADMAVGKLYSLPSRKAMTSGTLKEVPDESAFIQYLNKRLEENEDKFISSEELFTRFRRAVLNNSPNVPQYGTIKDAGDEGGEFIFIKR